MNFNIINIINVRDDPLHPLEVEVRGCGVNGNVCSVTIAGVTIIVVAIILSVSQ